MPWADLGDWPTPVDRIDIDGAPIWIKREGDSSAIYGGNKVRTLEAWLGHTRGVGARRIWAIGAYGSNHVVATVLHARRLGLDAGAIVFPQPGSDWAHENAGALIGSGVPIVRLRNVVEVPFAGLAIAAQASIAGSSSSAANASMAAQASIAGAHAPRASSITSFASRLASTSASRLIDALVRDRHVLGMLVGRELAQDSIVMPPGGATPIGTLGALSAAFELAEQVASGGLPAPRRIVLPAGSTCTTAGLLSGLALAHAIGAWRWPLPVVHAVRVTPWPVTSRLVITRLAEATLARIASLGGPRVPLGDARLVIDRGELGRGYGQMTERGLGAILTFGAAVGAPRLDGVYSAKAAAALLRLHRRGIGPLLFWSTKSSVVMPAPGAEALRAAPPALVRWLG